MRIFSGTVTVGLYYVLACGVAFAALPAGKVVGLIEGKELAQVSLVSGQKISENGSVYIARGKQVVARMKVVKKDSHFALVQPMEGLPLNEIHFDDRVYSKNSISFTPFSVEVTGVEMSGRKAWVSLGSVDGVLENMTFEVVRGNKVIGKARVEGVKEESAMLVTDAGIDLGDTVKGLIPRLEADAQITSVAKKGAFIIINISKNKLFLYRDGRLWQTFPVATGRVGLRTPVGMWKILSKITNPHWQHPSGKIFPPGPLNPLGRYWLGLSRFGQYKSYAGQYGIHGTNQPWLIGRWVSHGCIRMHNAHIQKIFSLVSVGTPVKVVR